MNINIEQYKDPNNHYNKFWSKYENIENLPKFYNQIIQVDYKDFKNNIDSLDEDFAEGLVKSLLSGNLYILKNAFSKEYLKKLKIETLNSWKNIKSEFHKIYENCPNFYRNIDTSLSEKYAFKQIKKTQYFFPWNKDPLNLYDEIYKRWRLLKFISGYYQDAWEKNTPKDGIIDRIQVVKYPNNSGQQELHQDPYLYQKFFISLYLSKQGEDFLDGGIYLIDKNKNKFSLESLIDVGDMSFGFGTIYHGVDIPKPIDISNTDELLGRWWIGLYSTASDYVKDRHTGSPASLK